MEMAGVEEEAFNNEAKKAGGFWNDVLQKLLV